MKVYVKAWQNVINPSTQEVYDEIGLKVLDSLRYGPIRIVEKVTPEIREEMVEEFRKMYPDFQYDSLKIFTDEFTRDFCKGEDK